MTKCKDCKNKFDDDYYRSSVTEVPFGEIKSFVGDDLSWVMTGAGKPYEGFASGFQELLVKEGIQENPDVQTFKKIAVITGNVKGKEGRTDLLMVFNPEAKINVGKLAIARIRFGSLSWHDDFTDNYAKDYGQFTHAEKVRNEFKDEIEESSKG